MSVRHTAPSGALSSHLLRTSFVSPSVHVEHDINVVCRR